MGNGYFQAAGINRFYQATNNAKFSENLPQGYVSAIFTNNSGHYLLIRLGGVDGPTTSSSAEHTIPPYTKSGVSLRGNMVGLRFTDTPGSVGSNLSTGLDGPCDAVYDTKPITEFSVSLPGATASTVVFQPSTFQYFGFADDFTNPNDIIIMKIGPFKLRASRCMPGEEPASLALLTMYTANQIAPAVPLIVLAQGIQPRPTTFQANVDWGPSPDGSELNIPITQAVYATCNQSMLNCLFYGEFRQ